MVFCGFLVVFDGFLVLLLALVGYFVRVCMGGNSMYNFLRLVGLLVGSIPYF